MKIVTAVDSFKGSLSSMEAAEAIANGIRCVFPRAEIQRFPLADGGEGTVETILSAQKGVRKSIDAQDPLGRMINVTYGILPQSRTAVLEMAAAAGLPLLKPEERNPLFTDTYGVGQILLDALDHGCRDFIIGIGGSATNDGGVGMLRALGFAFLNEAGEAIPRGGIGLRDLRSVRADKADPRLKDCRFRVACDVTNPLCGERGCSHVFAPQKGADEVTVRQMDAWLESYHKITKAVLPNANDTFPGSGAAGGLGYALHTYLGAELTSGIQLILEELGLEEAITNADLVITGEGRMDGQSAMGKAPVGVAQLAKKHGKTVIAFCGCATEDAGLCNTYGIDAIFPILRVPCTVEEAMEPLTATQNLKLTAEQVFRLIKANLQI